MFGNVGWPELLIVLVILLVIFGAKRLPEVGRSLGSGMRGFKDSISGKDDADDVDRKSTRLNSSHIQKSRMPSSA